MVGLNAGLSENLGPSAAPDKTKDNTGDKSEGQQRSPVISPSPAGLKWWGKMPDLAKIWAHQPLQIRQKTTQVIRVKANSGVR